MNTDETHKLGGGKRTTLVHVDPLTAVGHVLTEHGVVAVVAKHHLFTEDEDFTEFTFCQGGEIHTRRFDTRLERDVIAVETTKFAEEMSR